MPITGATGSTAAAIVAAGQQAGHEEIAWDRPRARDGAPRQGGKGAPLSATYPLVDVAAAMRSADAVVHLAVAVADGAPPNLPFAVDVRGTDNVLRHGSMGQDGPSW